MMNRTQAIRLGASAAALLATVAMAAGLFQSPAAAPQPRRLPAPAPKATPRIMRRSAAPVLVNVERDRRGILRVPSKPATPDAPRYAPFAEYAIPRRYRSDKAGPTCVVTFSDGETVRMTTASIPGKPLNVGRGLKLAVAAWRSRARAKGLASRTRIRPLNPPRVTSCHFERNGETLATFDPVICSRAIAA
jgi:hypothetical protein